MYLRETGRQNKDGSRVSYLQLAHNERNPATGMPTAKVIHNFGRADQVDRAALARLVGSISRFLGPTDAALVAAEADTSGVTPIDARPMGGAWALDGLWRRLGIDKTMRTLAALVDVGAGHPAAQAALADAEVVRQLSDGLVLLPG